MSEPVAFVSNGQCEQIYKTMDGTIHCILSRGHAGQCVVSLQTAGSLVREAALAAAAAVAVKSDAVIKAATLCNFCPSEGGYKEGQSVEGCYEQLSETVNDYYGVDIDAYDHPWWTEEEMWAALGKKP